MIRVVSMLIKLLIVTFQYDYCLHFMCVAESFSAKDDKGLLIELTILVWSTEYELFLPVYKSK